VGNEVLYREELSEEELLDYIKRVRDQVPEAKVGYVDAYYEFINRPAITEICDVIFTNCYPILGRLSYRLFSCIYEEHVSTVSCDRQRESEW
jgi:exo-beta-1,3-glucanase (GH17 family)